jgi:hypothetical protein
VKTDVKEKWKGKNTEGTGTGIMHCKWGEGWERENKLYMEKKNRPRFKTVGDV